MKWGHIESLQWSEDQWLGFPIDVIDECAIFDAKRGHTLTLIRFFFLFGSRTFRCDTTINWRATTLFLPPNPLKWHEVIHRSDKGHQKRLLRRMCSHYLSVYFRSVVAHRLQSTLTVLFSKMHLFVAYINRARASLINVLQISFRTFCTECPKASVSKVSIIIQLHWIKIYIFI